MATQVEALEALPFRCVSLRLAAIDAPVFILRAQDVLEPRVVSDGLTWPRAPEVHMTKCKVRW
jgi:hypothetical protein